jgi:hypothetical protein
MQLGRRARAQAVARVPKLVRVNALSGKDDFFDP